MRPKRGRSRQLDLTEMARNTPQWSALPEECRREVIELLAKLVRNEVAGEEKGDE
jgi:hypothetical protein